jgi:hypothetical protein
MYGVRIASSPGMALRGAQDYKDEVQQQFNAHKEKHLQI